VLAFCGSEDSQGIPISKGHYFSAEGRCVGRWQSQRTECNNQEWQRGVAR